MGLSRKSFRHQLTNWKWWYKIIGFLLALGGLVTLLVSGILNIHREFDLEGINLRWEIYDRDGNRFWDYDSSTLMYFSYFTTQTNILVMIWFLIAVIKPQQEGKGRLLSYTGTLLIATYISITSIVWLTILLPGMIVSKIQRPSYEWPASVLLHLIVPVMFVLYFTLWMNQTKELTTKRWVKISWVIILYPVIYGVLMLIRGEVRLASGYSSITSYPYFFLEVHETFMDIPGYAWFFIALGVVLAVAFGFSTLYALAIEKRQWNRHPKVWKTRKP